MSTLEGFTDGRQGDGDGFKLDGFDTLGLEADEDDEDDFSDYDDAIVGKKRKRAGTEASENDINHSKQVNMRIKAEGGEAFILDEGTSSLANHQSSRVFGTFGRRKCSLVWIVFRLLTTSRRPPKG